MIIVIDEQKQSLYYHYCFGVQSRAHVDGVTSSAVLGNNSVGRI